MWKALKEFARRNLGKMSVLSTSILLWKLAELLLAPNISLTTMGISIVAALIAGSTAGGWLMQGNEISTDEQKKLINQINNDLQGVAQEMAVNVQASPDLEQNILHLKSELFRLKEEVSTNSVLHNQEINQLLTTQKSLEEKQLILEEQVKSIKTSQARSPMTNASLFPPSLPTPPASFPFRETPSMTTKK